MKYKIVSSINGRNFREETTEAISTRQATQILAPELNGMFRFNQGIASVMIGSIHHSVFPMEM